MEISLRLTKDIAEAIDKLVDAVKKLGSMAYAAGATATEVTEKSLAVLAQRRLRELSTKSTYLVEQLCPRLLNSMEKYLNLRDPGQWNEFQKEVETTLLGVRDLAEKIDKSSHDITTKDFFPLLVRAVTSREMVLMDFSQLKPPTTPEEVDAARDLVAKYAELMAALSKTTKQLGSYIDALDAKKT